jgi:glycosyltransferase involved in cell wall biosynthesis
MQRVSIIIPAYNEEKVLPRLFKSIKSQSYSNIETVVVDDSSTDGTYKVARKFTKKSYNRQHRERSVQRNFGASKASGEYYLFLDADMELSGDVVKECVEEAEKNKKIGAIVIPEKSVSSNYWEKVKAFERSFYNEEGDNVTDAARFISKKAFLKAGGYDEQITGPEDWDLPETISKLGFKIGRTKAYINHYERINGPIHVAKKKFYYGLKAHRYFKKQEIGAASAKTIYFLRPVFYKKFYKFFREPLLSAGLFVMLTAELVFGGAGFLIGKIQNK